MNINRKLLEDTYSEEQTATWIVEQDALMKYDCPRDRIEHFMTSRSPFLERQQEAIDIIEGIMTLHGKKRLLKYVTELARVEHGIRELQPWQRDHVVHALLSFVLGIYINEKFFEPEEQVNDFQWKLAGLLHDVGYPVQIAKDILKPYEKKINEIRQDLGAPTPDIQFTIVPIGLENLTNGINSLDLIQERVKEWDLEIDVRYEYETMINFGTICHGIISSLSILNVLDLMYHKFNKKRVFRDIYDDHRNLNWNQVFFTEDIVSSCSAIFLHNLREGCFANAKIQRSKAPVAFLLKLSDVLQDWERPSEEDPRGLPASKFDIDVTEDGLFFFADVPDEKKEKIQNELFSCLDAPDIKFL